MAPGTGRHLCHCERPIWQGFQRGPRHLGLPSDYLPHFEPDSEGRERADELPRDQLPSGSFLEVTGLDAL